MVEFKKYPSITNSYEDEFIQKVKLHNFADEPYCVTEKVHGTNTQLCYNCKDETFQIGKRTEFLLDGEKCYNVQDCLQDIKEKLVEIANALNVALNIVDGKVLETVTIYGEACGGTYPHPDVKPDRKATKCQKGVWYCNSNAWLAFDIAYKIEDDERTYFLPAKDFFEFCNEYDIPTVPLIAVCENLDVALKIPNDELSTVYKMFNLPPIEGNIEEGIVIKPYNSDLWMGMSRVVIKNKNEKFKEKSRIKKDNIQQMEELPENVKEAMAEIATYATENRVINVLSHLGELSKSEKIKMLGQIIGMVNKDAITDAEKDGVFNGIAEKAEQKRVTKYLNNKVADVVKKVILNS